jgi:hypothetical protein
MSWSTTRCTHPEPQRWQWHGWWECCLCLKAYWGRKTGPEALAHPVPVKG